MKVAPLSSFEWNLSSMLNPCCKKMLREKHTVKFAEKTLWKNVLKNVNCDNDCLYWTCNQKKIHVAVAEIAEAGRSGRSGSCFTSRSGTCYSLSSLVFGRDEFTVVLSLWPETKVERMLDISSNCCMDGLLLYESILESLLWPVTALILRASTFSSLSSPSTVTVLALMQWLVKCREMPALVVIFFIISAKGLLT